MFGGPLWITASLAQTYARMGRRKDTEALYRELQWSARREFVAPLFPAVAAAYARGERDEARRLAQEAHTLGDPTPMGVANRYSKRSCSGTLQNLLLVRGVPKQTDTNRNYQNLRSNADADRDVFAVFFAICNFCVRVDLQFAFHGRVLIDEERHCFGFSLLRQLLTCGGLIRCYG
jgi:hypothetical protein